MIDAIEVGSDDLSFPTLGFMGKTNLLRVIEDGNIMQFFEETDARQYIREVSVRRSGKLILDDTIRKAGVPVEFNPKMIFDGRYFDRYAYSQPGPYIVLRSGLPDETFVYGHELGHHFTCDILNVGDNLLHSGHETISEAFCDYFGHMMEDPLQDPVKLEAQVKAEAGIPENYPRFAYEKMYGPGTWIEFDEDV